MLYLVVVSQPVCAIADIHAVLLHVLLATAMSVVDASLNSIESHQWLAPQNLFSCCIQFTAMFVCQGKDRKQRS